MRGRRRRWSTVAVGACPAIRAIAAPATYGRNRPNPVTGGTEIAALKRTFSACGMLVSQSDFDTYGNFGATLSPTVACRTDWDRHEEGIDAGDNKDFCASLD